jgi:hypothetical protein
MLDQTAIPQATLVDQATGQPVDRSMDVLQYATAFVAGLVAILLAIVH